VFSGIALQSFLGLLFEKMVEILRFWQGGVNRKGATMSNASLRLNAGNILPEETRATIHH
jgi:hypothetical protein